MRKRWPLQPLQPLQQTQLQPPFGQSVASLCHPWFTTTNVSYRFPIFETSATALCGTTGNCTHICNILISLSIYTYLSHSIPTILCHPQLIPNCCHFGINLRWWSLAMWRNRCWSKDPWVMWWQKTMQMWKIHGVPFGKWSTYGGCPKIRGRMMMIAILWG